MLLGRRMHSLRAPNALNAWSTPPLLGRGGDMGWHGMVWHVSAQVVWAVPRHALPRRDLSSVRSALGEVYPWRDFPWARST